MNSYKQIGSAFVKLMDPLVEVVIHDIKTDRIVFVDGKLSKRKVGEPSLLDMDEEISDVIYPKINFDGKLVKAISIPLEDDLLMCINCDVSIFETLKNLTSKILVSHGAKQPESLFKRDYTQRINQFIYSHIKGKTINELSTKEKKELIYLLYKNEAFAEKNAPAYIAQILKMGRATIFKYLKEWRQQNEA